MRVSEFVVQERAHQALILRDACAPEAILAGEPYRLKPGLRRLNLAPQVQDVAERYFAGRNITWHAHANHGLSSQVCCLNFLMPLAERPAVLGEIVASALNLEAIELLPVEDGPDGRPWYVGFEWIGRKCHLNEWMSPLPARGANVTSTDAVVRFRQDGLIHTALIEWKYTEAYGSPVEPSGNPVRVERYKDKVFAPHGPLRADLGLELRDFFWEPFYQLLRQQMLAWQMQAAREDDADRVVVLHLSPQGNRDLRRVTAPKLKGRSQDALEVFGELLAKPEDFQATTLERAFARSLAMRQDDPDSGLRDWARYVAARYPWVIKTAEGPERVPNRAAGGRG